MIRKPDPSWKEQGESSALRTARTAVNVAHGGAQVARAGGHVARGLLCFAFAVLWGFAALASGLGGSLPSFIGVGAMAVFMAWVGKRAFAKAREISD